jgi:hypothetical protein
VGEALFAIMHLPVTLQWQIVAYPTWRRKLRRISIALLVVSLEGFFREHAPRVRVSLSLRSDGPYLVVSSFFPPMRRSGSCRRP